MLGKMLRPLARYLLGGMLPALFWGAIRSKLQGASHKEEEHLDEVLLNAALTAVIAVSLVGLTLFFVRWLVVARGVESGPLVLLTAWLAGVALLLLFVLSSFWAWKRYGFFHGILMLSATVLATLVLGGLLVLLLLFFGFGLKLLR